MRLSGKFHAATALTPTKKKKSSESTGRSEPVLIRRQEEIPALSGGDLDSPSFESQSGTVLRVPPRCPMKVRILIKTLRRHMSAVWPQWNR